MNSKPLVWILYPDTPQGNRTELIIYQEQWSKKAWWLRWWAWCFFWWNKKLIDNTSKECISTIVKKQQITELQRLLGGDVQCKNHLFPLAPAVNKYTMFPTPEETLNKHAVNSVTNYEKHNDLV